MKYNEHPYRIKKTEFGNFNEKIERKFKFKKIYNKFDLKLRDYEFLFSYTDYYDLNKEKILYDDSNNIQKCIFCLKDDTETSFENKPHVIPYFLGNKYLLHSNECDECNAYFSKSLEDALDKYTAPFRTLNLIKNRRNKLTKVTSQKGDFIYAYNTNKKAFTISGDKIDNYVFDDEEKKVLTIVFDIKRHRPIDVYKAFMKIFYGLLPRDEHKNFTELRKWIMNQNIDSLFVKPLRILRSWHPSFNTMPLTIFIMHRKNKLESNPNFFDYSGLISFGNIIYEMPIFSDDFLKHVTKLKLEGKPLNFTMQLLPKPFEVVNTEIIDLSYTDFLTDRCEVNFKYKDRVQNV
ncbi:MULTISPECIES: HNH endonuclease [Acinetobacter calcoaceticus/baumannii complex]|uniref:HNH endonuclease n=2 Tax=Acinetobacter pittii TaxID=48296 RepID=A0AAE9M720_ACIPI|nr:HNH endonuclease [Acinetobacter pittii]USU93997.1 HNH endonuclease [Acinetobacter pittii]